MKGLKPILIPLLAIGLLSGSAIGVAAQDDSVDLRAPATFEGSFGPQRFSADAVTGLPVTVSTFEATDPRASGTWTQFKGTWHVNLDRRTRYQVFGHSDRLVNVGGSWVGTTRAVVATELPDGGGRDGRFIEMTGEGGYEGLTMFIFSMSTDAEPTSLGFIVPVDELQPFPEPPSGEHRD